MNELALFKMNFEKFAGHLGSHRDGVGSDVADGGQLHGHGSLGDFRHNHGNSRWPGRRRGLLLRTAGGRQEESQKERG